MSIDARRYVDVLAAGTPPGTQAETDLAAATAAGAIAGDEAGRVAGAAAGAEAGTTVASEAGAAAGAAAGEIAGAAAGTGAGATAGAAAGTTAGGPAGAAAATALLAARTVTGGGLATGGGTLDVNRVITVAAASQAEAEAGAATTVAMTPQRSTQHFNARVSAFMRGVTTAADADAARVALGADLSVNVKYSAPGSSPLPRTVSGVLNDAIRLADYNLGTGTNATAALAAAIADGVARGIGRIIVRGGHYLLTDAPIAAAGFVLEGDGDSSRITVGAANSNVLSISGDNVTLRGLRIQGDDTANSTATGLGVIFSGGGLLVEDVLFDTLGLGCLKGTTSTNKKGPKLVRIRGRGNGKGASGFPVEVWINGAFQSTLLEDADFVTADTRYGLLLAESGGTALWQHCEVRGGWFEGLLNYGIAASDETYTGADRAHGLDVSGGYYRNCMFGALKAKQCKVVTVRALQADGCGDTPENPGGSLRGTIIMHGVGAMTVEGCILRDNGSSGIQVAIPYDPAKFFPNGVGMPTVKLIDNVIEGAGTVAPTYGDAISCVGPCQDLTIARNTGWGFSRYGIYHETGSMRTQVLHLTGNTMKNAPTASTQGIYVKDVWSVHADGNDVFNVYVTGTYFENCYSVQIGTGDRAGDCVTPSVCYGFVNVSTIQFNGAASCFEYAGHAVSTAYTVGQRVYNGSLVYECTIAGTTGAASPPTGTGQAITDGTVRWCYVQVRRANVAGVSFGANVGRCLVGAAAQFENLVGPWASGTLPGQLHRANYYTNVGSLVAGEITFNLAWPEPDNDYIVTIDGNGAASEVFRSPDADKTTTSFKVKSSDVASTALVRVSVSR